MRDPLDEETVLDVLMTIEDMIAEKPRTPKPKDSVARSFNRLDTYTPIRLAAEEFLNDQSLPPKTGLVMGMDLFLSTYEGFLWADERLNVQSCRELAVRLSKDMQVGILPVITIVEAMIQQDHLDGEKTVLEGLKQLHEDLKNYQRQEAPELLYHQAPWTAGHHMAEMLARAHLLGHRITCEWNVVPSTLHMYNALCQSDFNLPKIGLMEELCELFKETLFLGNRPDRNFVSHYRRSTFETSISSGSLKISMNKRATRVLNKPSPSFRRKPVDSALTTLHLNEHRLSPIVLCKLYDLPMSADPSPAMREGVRMATDSPFHNFIENAKDKLLPELQGPCPVARVNHFAILVLCARILRDFSRQIHPSTYRTLRSTGNPKSPAIKGAMMADTVLQAIVSEPEMGKMGKTLQDVQMLQAAAEAFESVDKTATLKQFLWKV
ncbi:hypothetical protein CGLO_05221 [Colletotrichum gloeosporioides Cg-14]|uniref:Uncharacterized protein n=1 Tax=Colletotrichum gloeosporioides (strain Cg-14) TaxID=1237896 RepID=T0KQK1_COLGC|nr:hypothetical protein CGLO_05221 [Colletotrichum gloeosporioides Cg-14]